MNTKIIVATIAGMLISPLVMSEDAPSYSFIEGGYTSYDVGDFKPKGYKLKGSVEVGEMFFITADYSDTTGTVSGFNIDIDFVSTGFGGGVKYDLSDKSSIYASYTLNTWEIGSTFGGSSDLDFNTLRLGFRQNISELLELNASITSNEIDDAGAGDESDSGYQFGLVYALSDSVKMTVDYDTIDDLKISSVGIRLNF
ncbi:MAG: hypothetical protein COA86_01535 [Kangiella sp.]|nr:MAG: hypothetical protein COA86_01535 [Kangiella sp.]